MALIRPTPEQYGITGDEVAELRSVGTYVTLMPPALGALAGIGWAVTSGEPSLVIWVAVLLAGACGFGVGFLFSLAGHAFWDRLGFPPSATLHGFWRFQRDLARYEAAELRQREAFWLRLSGRGFELEMARLFAQSGWAVKVTPESGDQGVDLFLRRGAETVVVQCKATGKPVGPAVVRDLYGTMTAHHADSAIIASLAGVTAGAKSFMTGKPMTILTLRQIMDMHDRASGS